jgi:hypothetical protein
VNDYCYETKIREEVYFGAYRSIQFFTGFVEYQEQGLQQQKKKRREQYEHLVRKYRERFPDADKN